MNITTPLFPEHNEPDDRLPQITVQPLPDVAGFEHRTDGVLVSFIFPDQTLCIPLPESAADQLAIGLWSILGELMRRRSLAGDHTSEDDNDSGTDPSVGPTKKCPFNFPPKL